MSTDMSQNEISNSPESSGTSATSDLHSQSTKRFNLETAAWYVFLVAIVLAPLSFSFSQYISPDLIRTMVIMLGVIIPAICLGISAVSNRRLVLPPRSQMWTGLLLVISLFASSFASIHITKSLIGRGFELGTTSFVLGLFLATLVAYTLVQRRVDRAIAMYVLMTSSFLVLCLFHVLRLIFGVSFMSFGVFNSLTSSPIGSWYSLAGFAALVAMISLGALLYLPLSKRMKISYWLLTALSAIVMYVVNDARVWFALAIVLLGLTIYVTMSRPRSTDSGKFKGYMKRMAYIPLIGFVIAAVLSWYGPQLAGPAINSTRLPYFELSLPWQMTLDVASGAIKNYPLLGVGPNHFSEAYLVYKPSVVNLDPNWEAEFSSGFGYIPTMIVSQGIIGLILWILFFVFYGIAGTRSLKRLSGADGPTRFMTVVSFAGSVVGFMIMLMSVPSHALLFLTFLLAGIFLGVSTVSGSLTSSTIAPQSGTRSYKLMPSLMSLLVIVAVVWGLLYIKKTIAFTYFASGVKELKVVGNPTAAEMKFARAQSIDASDVYLEARAEAILGEVNQLASSVPANAPASTSQEVLTKITDNLNRAVPYVDAAIAYDPSFYNNYVSKARLSATAMQFRMPNAYDAAVQAYNDAIRRNPYNPALYLSLARIQASQNKLDDSLRSLGAALQLKNNYLDAVYALSQVYTAKGDLPNAITASLLGVQLNPQNPVLLFQLGLLYYQAKSYQNAALALAQAVKLQPDYANAKYFLGLAYARLDKIPDAVQQFTDIQNLSAENKANPDISLIITTLQSGKSIFADVPAVTSPAPEKRPALPIKEKK